MVNINYSSASSVSESKCINSCGTTKYERSFQKVLNRKKRYLIFPPGSNVVVSTFDKVCNYCIEVNSPVNYI